MLARIGRMDQLVKIQAPTEPGPQDAYGAEALEYSTAAVRWGSLEPLTGREYFQAGQVQADVSHRIRMWWYPGLTTRHRLEIEDRTLEIVSIIDPDNAHRELEVMVKEKV